MASSKELFANLFTSLSTGLKEQPKDPAAAIANLPAPSRVPPPWLTWTMLLVAWIEGMRKYSRVLLHKSLPRDIPIPEGYSANEEGREIVIPHFDDERPWTCKISLHEDTAVLRHRATGEEVREYVDVRRNGSGGLTVGFDPEFYDPTPEEVLERYDRDPRGQAERRLRQLLPERDWLQNVFTALMYADVVEYLPYRPCNLEPSQIVVSRDQRRYRKLAMQLFQKLEDPQWQPWLAAASGDWLWALELAKQAGDTALLDAIRPRVDESIRHWFSASHPVSGVWAACAMQAVKPQGREFQRECVSPHFRRLDPARTWIWAPLFANDHTWCPEVYGVFVDLVESRDRHAESVAFECARFLIAGQFRIEQVLNRVATLNLTGCELEQSALMLLEHASHLALPTIRKSLRESMAYCVPAVLATIDTDWSRRELLDVLAEHDATDSDFALPAAWALCRSSDDAARQSAEEWLTRQESGDASYERECFDGAIEKHRDFAVRHRDTIPGTGDMGEPKVLKMSTVGAEG